MSGAEGDAPGLALYHQTSTDPEALADRPQAAERPLERCPNKASEVFFDLVTGEVRNARCARNGCPYCLPVNAWIRGLAVSYARPQRMVRISLVADAGEPDPWSTARRRMNRLVEYARRLDIGIGEIHYVIEPNPNGTGYHAQAVQWGARKIDKDALDQCSFRAGAGLARVEKLRAQDRAAGYGMKNFGAGQYGMKNFGESTDVDPCEALRINGGRLGHQTRGFFRSEGGGTLPVREVERRALQARFPRADGGRQWRLVPAANVASLASLRPRAAAGPVSGTP